MPVIETPYAPSAAPEPPKPDGPVSLGGELSVACPERTAPRYPSASRRMGEEGTVVLRVELDEAGHVTHARVQTGSGHARLDETAIATVQTWRCTPALRDGRPVRAIALQPFKFVLQGN
jgi:protein TonB